MLLGLFIHYLCLFFSPSCDMMELRRRYQNLYIPSDFFDAQFTWVDAFPLSRPFQLGNYCNFYVMHREVESLEKNMAILDPPDADHLYSAKVCILRYTAKICEQLFTLRVFVELIFRKWLLGLRSEYLFFPCMPDFVLVI